MFGAWLPKSLAKATALAKTCALFKAACKSLLPTNCTSAKLTALASRLCSSKRYTACENANTNTSTNNTWVAASAARTSMLTAWAFCSTTYCAIFKACFSNLARLAPATTCKTATAFNWPAFTSKPHALSTSASTSKPFCNALNKLAATAGVCFSPLMLTQTLAAFCSS